jgi:hypothetical protein
MTKNNESFQYLVDSYQVAGDAVKQVATLSAGSIVVIGTFLTDIFPSNKQGVLQTVPVIKLLITAAFALFVVSLISSAVTMYRYAKVLRFLAERTPQVQVPKTLRSPPGPISLWAHHMPLTTYTVGVFFFGLAVVLHLNQ